MVHAPFFLEGYQARFVVFQPARPQAGRNLFQQNLGVAQKRCLLHNKERGCPGERSEAISLVIAGDRFGKERLAMTRRCRLWGGDFHQSNLISILLNQTTSSQSCILPRKCHFFYDSIILHFKVTDIHTRSYHRTTIIR